MGGREFIGHHNFNNIYIYIYRIIGSFSSVCEYAQLPSGRPRTFSASL